MNELHNHIIYATTSGELWLGTDSAVDLFDQKKGLFIHFTHDSSNAKSISYKRARVFFEDSKKNLWIGTQGGLNVFIRKDSSFSYYLEEHGLPNNQIKGILEDDHGNLWISTNKGISKFIHGTDRPHNPVFKNYDVWDGLQGNEYNENAVTRVKTEKCILEARMVPSGVYIYPLQTDQYSLEKKLLLMK